MHVSRFIYLFHGGHVFQNNILSIINIYNCYWSIKINFKFHMYVQILSCYANKHEVYFCIFFCCDKLPFLPSFILVCMHLKLTLQREKKRHRCYPLLRSLDGTPWLKPRASSGLSCGWQTLGPSPAAFPFTGIGPEAQVRLYPPKNDAHFVVFVCLLFYFKRKNGPNHLSDKTRLQKVKAEKD